MIYKNKCFTFIRRISQIIIRAKYLPGVLQNDYKVRNNNPNQENRLTICFLIQ
jgi:hypothetical protein